MSDIKTDPVTSTLNFDPMKKKNLAFGLEVEGVDPGELEYRFVIKMDGVEFGFMGEVASGKVRITVPALSSVIANFKNGVYEAHLEARKEKYVITPWKKNVSVGGAPKVKVEGLVYDIDEGGSESITVKASLEGDKPAAPKKSKVIDDNNSSAAKKRSKILEDMKKVTKILDGKKERVVEEVQTENREVKKVDAKEVKRLATFINELRF